MNWTWALECYAAVGAVLCLAVMKNKTARESSHAQKVRIIVLTLIFWPMIFVIGFRNRRK